MRKRRAKRTWFPVLPTVYGPGAGEAQTFFHTNHVLSWSSEGPSSGVTQVIDTTPLLADGDVNADQFSEDITLRDRVEGKDYVTTRIVGKIWGGPGWSQSVIDEQAVTGINQVIFAAGIAVFPADENTGDPALTDEEQDPFKANNSAGPWAWRRTWTMSNPSAIPLASGLASSTFAVGNPISIGGFGSMADGGHVDCKVGRRVSREQRLYFVFAAAILDGNLAVSDEDMNITYGYDLRVLGAMRKARNRSVFT